MTILNLVPDFTSDEGNQEEVKKTPSGVEEKETLSEPPAEEKPDDITNIVDDTEKLSQQVQGLQEERGKLLKEIVELRGQRREIKQNELLKIEEKIEELKDVHPDDVVVIEKILRSKGYVTKDEAHKMFYDSVKQEELNKFLDKYPEYKPENDTQDINWGSLQKELGFYRMPDNPYMIKDVLERAHRVITKVSSGLNLPVKKRQIEIAGAGAGGVQRSSSHKALDPEKRLMLQQGGWSEEEIKKIEQRL